jgi:hypothetical protein
MCASICNKRHEAAIIWCYGLIVIGKEKTSVLKVVWILLFEIFTFFYTDLGRNYLILDLGVQQRGFLSCWS